MPSNMILYPLLIKNVKKKGRVRHLPDSHLQLSPQWRAPDATLNHVHRQFEMAYQLVLQLRQSPSIIISASPTLTSLSPLLLETPANTVVSLLLHLLKGTVLAESSILYFIFSPDSLHYFIFSPDSLHYFIFSPDSLHYFIFSLDSLHYNDVYKHESDRCSTLPFFLTFFIISPFQIFLLY